MSPHLIKEDSFGFSSWNLLSRGLKVPINRKDISEFYEKEWKRSKKIGFIKLSPFRFDFLKTPFLRFFFIKKKEKKLVGEISYHKTESFLSRLNRFILYMLKTILLGRWANNPNKKPEFFVPIEDALILEDVLKSCRKVFE